ncbi:hypothetical protein [Streptomyces sp. NPDC050704]|uniref:hypothetical protein n=1 Tax=Streptomyces sp. NPDC050704 TaxID=3157219 RepID=UPI00341F1BCB
MYGPWALADAAWVSLSSGQENHRAPATTRDLAQIVGYHLALDDPVRHQEPGDRLDRYLLRISGQQFSWQVDDYAELARTIALLAHTTPGRDLEVIKPGWDQDLFGCSLADYVGLTRLIWGAVTQHPVLELRGRFHPGWAAGSGIDEFGSLATPEEVTAVLERHFVTTARRLQGTLPVTDDPLLRRYKPNPLRSRPLVGGYGDGYLVPVNNAVLGKASPLGVLHAAVEARGQAVTRDYGELLEQYVGRHLRLLPDADVHPEISYKEGTQNLKGIDWIVVFPNLVLLVEVKSARPTTGLWLGLDNFAATLNSRLGHAFKQIEKSAGLIADRHTAFAHIPTDRPVLGMVITLEPFHLINTPKLRASFPAITTPVTISSIHELEQAVTITDTSLASVLLGRTDKGGASLRDLFSGHEFSDHNPILEKAWSAIPMPGSGLKTRQYGGT